KIGDDAAERLMKRLLNPARAGNSVVRVKNLIAYKHIEAMFRVIREHSSVELEISRNGFGHHYAHFNTMTLSDESESIDQLSDEESGVTDAELKAWGDTWLRFYEALKQDIVDTSRSLES